MDSGYSPGSASHDTTSVERSAAEAAVSVIKALAEAQPTKEEEKQDERDGKDGSERSPDSEGATSSIPKPITRAEKAAMAEAPQEEPGADVEAGGAELVAPEEELDGLSVWDLDDPSGDGIESASTTEVTTASASISSDEPSMSEEDLEEWQMKWEIEEEIEGQETETVQVSLSEAEAIVGQELSQSSIENPEIGRQLDEAVPPLYVEVDSNGTIQYDPHLGAQIEEISQDVRNEVEDREEEEAEDSADDGSDAGQNDSEIRIDWNQVPTPVASVIETSEGLLDFLNEDSYEGSAYVFSRDEKGLTIESRDGRGTVLETTDDGIKSSLTPADFQRFEAGANLLAQMQQEQARQAAVAQPHAAQPSTPDIELD